MTATPPTHAPSEPQPALPGLFASVTGRPAVPLAERLVRALCVVGLVKVAGTAVTQFLAPALSAWSAGASLSLARMLWRSPWLMVLWALTELAAVVLLAAGAVGELLRKSWGRRLLYLYAAAWAVEWVVGVVAVYVMRAEVFAKFGTGRRPGVDWGALAEGAGGLLSEAAYPLLLVVCLRWPETWRATAAGRGFVPVLPTPQDGG